MQKSRTKASASLRYSGLSGRVFSPVNPALVSAAMLITILRG